MSEESDEEFVLSEEEEEGEEGDKIVKQNNNDEIVVPFSYKHSPLPIIAPDYSYVMNITEMKSLLITKEDRKLKEGEDDEEEDEEDPVSKRNLWKSLFKFPQQRVQLHFNNHRHTVT